MASAARNDFERLERLESASKRFFVSASIRMERVSVITCTRLDTSSHNGRQRDHLRRLPLPTPDSHPPLDIPPLLGNIDLIGFSDNVSHFRGGSHDTPHSLE